MKIRELIAELQEYDPEQEIVLAKDREGNDYSPLDLVTDGYYETHSTWSGTAYAEEDIKDGYGNAELPAVVVLWPVN